MSVELPSYLDYKDVSYTPMSFAVSPVPEQGAFLALPHESLPAKPSVERRPTPPSQSFTVAASSTRPSMRQSSRPSLMTTPAMQPPKPFPVAPSPRDKARVQDRGAIANAEPVLHPYPIAQHAPELPRPVPVLAPMPGVMSPVAPKPVPSPSLMPSPAVAQPATQTVAKSAVSNKAKQRSRITLLQTVNTLKWGTMVLASTLFATAFAAYGWTVALEYRGSDLNKQLNQLRDHEKGMTGMAAALGASMVDDSQKPESGLHLPSPGSIFPLELAEPRSPVITGETQDEVPIFQRSQPRGY